MEDVFFNLHQQRNPILAQYTLQNQPIKKVTSAKYLGVTILTRTYCGQNILNKQL